MSSSASSRVFVVTGATSGIGKAIARQAILRTHRVVLAARSYNRLHELAQEMSSQGDVLAVACDVTDWKAQQELAASACAAFGRIDVVVANAGVEKGAGLIGGPDTPDAWREMVLTNVYGTALTLRATLPALVDSCGDLVLMGSVAGRVALADSVYSGTKWAISGMAESARHALAGSGVRVLLIQPGRTDTPLQVDSAGLPLLDADAVARATFFALEQPRDTSINEIVVRPTEQEI